MKQTNLLATLIACLYLSVFFSSCKETDTIFTNNMYSVTLVDELGNPILITKGSSVLPTGSVINGTGYYADGDNCSLSYLPALGYSPTCQWNWHDTSKPVHSGSNSNNIISRDYTISITESTAPPVLRQTLTITTKGSGTIYLNGIEVQSGQSIQLERFSDVTIEAIAKVNYKFHSIEDRTALPAKVISLSNPFTFSIERDIMICVVFTT